MEIAKEDKKCCIDPLQTLETKSGLSLLEVLLKRGKLIK